MQQMKIPEPILQRLGQMRRAMRTWHLVAGVSRILAVLTIFMILSFGVDRLWRMDVVQRVICLVLGLGVAAWVAWRYLIRPMLVRLNADALVQKVEGAHPGTRNSIISAVQFASMEALPDGASAEMIYCTIDEGSTAAQDLNFSGVLDWRRFKQFLIVAGVALLIPVLFGVITPSTFSLWFRRNILMTRDKWPQDTHLRVEGLVDDKVLYVPEGGNLEIIVTVKGKAPDQVELRYEDDSGTKYDEQMPHLEDGTYRSSFTGVTEPFEFSVKGGDDEIGPFDVVLLPRPEVTEIQATVLPPAYVGKKEIPLEQGLSSFPVLKGSNLRINGRSSLPLKFLTLTNGGVTLAELDGGGKQDFVLGIRSKDLRTATYGLLLTSTENVPALRATPISVRLIADRPPKVKARLEGVGQLILPRAKVPISCEFTDDYGIVKALIDYRCESATEESQNRTAEIKLDVPEPGPATEFGARHVLDVAALNLGVETTITMRAAATDANSVDGPQTGQSGSFTLRLVTEDELRADLTRREQELRVRFDRMLKQQRELIDDTKLFAVKPEPGSDGVRQARQLRAEKRQRRLISVAGQLIDGFAQLRDEVLNNKLESEPFPLQKRFEFRVLQPLETVRTELLPQATDLVGAARELPLDKQLAVWPEVEKAQMEVAAALLEIRKNIVESEDVQKAIRLMEEILGEQKKLNRATIEKITSAIEGLFND